MSAKRFHLVRLSGFMVGAAALALSGACARPASTQPQYFESKVPGVPVDPDGAQGMSADPDGVCYESCSRRKEQCLMAIPQEATDLEWKRAQSSCTKRQWACWESCP